MNDLSKPDDNGVIYGKISLPVDDPSHPPEECEWDGELTYYRLAKDEDPGRAWTGTIYRFDPNCGNLFITIVLGIKAVKGRQEVCTGGSGTYRYQRHIWRALRYRPATGHRNYFHLPRPEDHVASCDRCRSSRYEWENDAQFKRRMNEHSWFICAKCEGIRFGSRWG